jgi:hypothetical protein
VLIAEHREVSECAGDPRWPERTEKEIERELDQLDEHWSCPVCGARELILRPMPVARYFGRLGKWVAEHAHAEAPHV